MSFTMESPSDKLLYLLEDIKSKIVYLENALDDITQVKKSLKVSSIDVKAQIRDSISRHLEALRNREIWLLSQVELIVHGKEDVLSQKHGELLEVISGMKKVCELLEHCSGSENLEQFEDQLSYLINSVEKLNVSAEENPNIGFTGQNLELLESIRGFGHVDQSDESNFSALFKNMELTEHPGNKRKFVTDSRPIENWLLNRKRCEELHSSPASVEKWLTKCKPFSDVDSEMGYSDMSDVDNKWLISLQKNTTEATLAEVTLAYFTEVKLSSHESWIRNSPKAPDLPKTMTGETYSKIASLGNENWLLYKQERCKQRSLPENLGNIHGMNDYSQWLKISNVVAVVPKTSTGKAYTAIANSNLKQWLKPKSTSVVKCNGRSDCSDCDRWLLNSSVSTASNKEDDLESMPDSDWLKVKDMDVLSIENLDLMFENCKMQTESCNKEDKSGLKSYHSMLQAQQDENWLRKPSTSETSNDMETKSQSSESMSIFSEYLMSNDYNKWLAKPSEVPSDFCKWLARSSLESCKNCPKETCSKGLFSLFDEVKEMNSVTWLKD